MRQHTAILFFLWRLDRLKIIVGTLIPGYKVQLRARYNVACDKQTNKQYPI